MPRQRRSQKRHDQADVVPRTDAFAVVPPAKGGKGYNLSSMDPELWGQFVEACFIQRRSKRWVLLTLITKFNKGEIAV